MLILETTFPATYRQEEIKKILSFAATGKFCQIVAVPGSGKATILRLLAHNRKLLAYHLGEQEKSLRVFYLNLLELPSLEIEQIVKHINVLTADNPIVSIDDHQSTVHLKETINSLTSQNNKLILLFDHFDEYQNQLPRTFFQLLRDFATVGKYKFSAVFATRRDLKDLVDPELIKTYYDFFLDNTVYLNINNTEATNLLLTQTEEAFQKKLSPADKSAIGNLTGGHAKLTKLIAELTLRENTKPEAELLIKNPLITAALFEIWDYLTAQEQQALKLKAVGNKPPEIVPQSLTDSGILNDKFKITIPIFEQFIASHTSKVQEEKITYSQDTKEIKKGDTAISDLLSPQEFRLLKFLIASVGKITGRDEIIPIVWPDAKALEGISDEAIDQMIFRLRKKIEDEPNLPRHITTVKGQGWRFSA